MMSLPKPNWPAVRLAYVNGEGSLRVLSERFGIPLRTIERRCASENWRRSMGEIGGIAAAVAGQVAAEQGRRLGLTAASLVERAVVETEGWLDRIEARANTGALDVAEIRGLVSAWKQVIQVGRQTFNLDDAPERKGSALVNVQAIGVVTVSPGGILPDGVEAADTLDLPDVQSEFPPENL